MKCPFCEKEGKRSKVYVGMTKATLMSYFSYYNEDGILQARDPNTYVTDFTCSNGHNFRVKEYGVNEIIFEDKEIEEVKNDNQM